MGAAEYGSAGSRRERLGGKASGNTNWPVWRLVVPVAALAALTCVHCSSDEEEASGASGGSGGAAGAGAQAGSGGTGGQTSTGGTGAQGGTGGAGGAGGQAGAGGAGGAPPDGSSCAQGLPVVLNTPGAGFIDPAGDVDWYRVDLQADDYAEVIVTMEDLRALDPVVSIYADDGQTLVATTAHGQDDPNRMLTYRAPDPATYCIKVEDRSTWTGQTPVGGAGPAYQYALRVVVQEMSGGLKLDDEPNDSLSSPQSIALALGGGVSWAILHGTLESATDQDVYTLSSPATTKSTLMYFSLFGTGSSGSEPSDGWGSTLQYKVDLTDLEGNVLARAVPTGGNHIIWVPRPTQDPVAIQVHRTDGHPVGANDFYVLRYFDLQTVLEAPVEVETAPGSNDTAAEAEALDSSNWVVGAIPAAGDVDYFSFEATAGETYALACAAGRLGSGLTGARFALHGPDDTEIQAETETAAADVVWSDVPDASMAGVTIATTGTHYIVVSADGQDPEVPSDYYHCILCPSGAVWRGWGPGCVH